MRNVLFLIIILALFAVVACDSHSPVTMGTEVQVSTVDHAEFTVGFQGTGAVV